MKLSFSTVMYEETNLPCSEVIARAVTLGYEGVELNFKVRPTELDIETVKEALNRFNVEIAAIGTRHLYVTHGLYLASPRRYVRKRALAYVRECMNMSQRLNCQQRFLT